MRGFVIDDVDAKIRQKQKEVTQLKIDLEALK